MSSRAAVLHPVIGYAIPMVYMFIMQTLWLGPVSGQILSQIFIAPGVFSLGVYSGSSALIAAAGWIASSTGTFVFGVFWLAWAGLMVTIGMKWYTLGQKICFVLTVISVVMMFYALGTTSKPAFINDYNNFAFLYSGVNKAYEQTLAAAGSNLAKPGTNLYSTFAAMSIASFGIFFTQLSATTCLGEIRKSESLRVQTISMIGSLVVFAIPFIALVPVLYNTIGADFSAALGLVQGTQNYPFPIPPYFNLFVHMMLGPNVLVQVLFLVTFNGWYWFSYTNGMLQASRMSVVYSLDRVLPESLGRVNQRFHTPHYGILAACLLGWTYCILWYIFPWFSTLFWDTVFVSFILFFFSACAAVLLPYRRKDLYEISPIAKYKISGRAVDSSCGTGDDHTVCLDNVCVRNRICAGEPIFHNPRFTFWLCTSSLSHFLCNENIQEKTRH